jgi:hypothetical protein
MHFPSSRGTPCLPCCISGGSHDCLHHPGGFFDALNKMNTPAIRMEVPIDADALTYANAHLTETIKVFDRFGVQFLSAAEIRTVMPQYPVGSDFR